MVRANGAVRLSDWARLLWAQRHNFICNYNSVALFFSKNGPTPASFSLFFKHKKTAGFSGIRTRIVGIEGKHADHLTTAHIWHFLSCSALLGVVNLEMPRAVESNPTVKRMKYWNKFWSQSVRPDWAIFERSRHKFSIQSGPKFWKLFELVWKTGLFKLKPLWLLFWQFWGKLGYF